MTHFTFDDRRHFDAPSVIRVKRDGGRLSDAAIDWVIDAYTHGRVADEQMSALLMAIFLRGMDRGEIARWTAAMVGSIVVAERQAADRLGRPVGEQTVQPRFRAGTADFELGEGRLLDEPEGIDPEPGDTVVEYRDGEAWIYVVPEPDGDPSPDRS